MKGLVIKDINTLLKQVRFILLLMVLFACLPGLSLSAFAVFYAAMLPISALAYDERSRWDELAAMMPYSIKAIVGSKYVLGLLLVAGVTLLAAASQLLTGIITRTTLDIETLVSLPIFACVSLLMMLIDLPLMFRVGVEKGRILYILLTCLCIILFINNSDKIMDALDNAVPFHVFLITLAATAILLVLSFFVSVRLYRIRRG